MKKLLFSLIFLFTAFAVQLSAQAKLTIQGVLKNADGTTVADGKYPIAFSLYTVASGGTPVWSETIDPVTVKGGIYSVVMGNVNALNVGFDQPYYLGVAVDGGAELIPRVQLTSAPYALSLLGESNKFPNAGNVGIGTLDPEEKLHVVGDVKIDGELEATSIAGAGTPAGIMAPFAGPVANIPAGYLLCDGSAVSSVDYPELFAAIGTAWGDGTAGPGASGTTDFNLPFTSGLFLRGANYLNGWDPHASNRGSLAFTNGGNTGNNVGSYQTDAVGPHSHTWNGYNNAAGGNDIQVKSRYPISSDPTDTATNSSGGAESRPKNVYVNYIIKY